MANIENYHRQPCANCGHRDLHGDVSGCVGMTSRNPDRWCTCEAYVAPRDRAQTAREGRQAATDGIAAAEGSYAMSSSADGREWTEKARARLDDLIAAGREFTAEDVTDTVGVAPSPSAIGGLFRAKAFKTRVDLVRIDTATRREAHGRPLRVWKAKAEVAAR